MSQAEKTYHGRMNSESIGATSCGQTKPSLPMVMAVAKWSKRKGKKQVEK